jgi:small subunit ribosomal protein S19e
MVKAYDVPADKLIEVLAEHLKKIPQIEVASWAQFVKTGSHAERPPQQPNWWYVRTASLLRKLYFHGPVGLSEIRSAYGGNLQVSYFPKHHRDAGSSINRMILKQLELAELVAKSPKGRTLTPKGIAFVDKVSKDVFKKLAEAKPELARYK